MSLLELRNVSKSFGTTRVVERFSATFGPGIHLVVGPNGSGKSTLLNLVAGSIAPDAGTIEIDGRCGEAAKSLAFLAPADAPAIPWLTGRRFIAFAAALFPTFRGNEAIEPLAARFGLAPFLDVALGDMSSGTARKALIAAAWISGAPVLLLDEPTNELDERSVDALIEVLMGEPQRTVLVATHLEGAFARLAPRTLRLNAPAPAPVS